MSQSPSGTSIRLGPFEILEPIGHGGMGEVWRGRHAGQRVDVAVKVIGGTYASDPAFVEAFESEVQAVARLNHPGIVMVFDYGTIPLRAADASEGRLREGAPYLVMEMASGGTLEDTPLTRTWPDLRAQLLVVLRALAHAHARGVIHRDVKPGNVLVATDQDLRPGLKLTDFGLAAAGERLKAERLTGTPAFMAPEQCDGRWRDHGPWTDLYSFGCLAYALATGEVPFDDTNPMQVVLSQFASAPPPLKPRMAVPNGFEDWLLRLLAKQPPDRFRWAADAAEALISLGDPHQGPTVHATPRGASSAPYVKHLLHRRPVLPSSWRHAEPPAPTIQMVGVGLGLYGLRTIPLCGREPERDAIWDTLAQVHDTGRSHVLLLQGESGTGKSRLAEWMSQIAHEMGAVSALRATHASTVAGPTEGLPRMLANHLRCIGLSRAETLTRVATLLADHGVDDDYEANALTEVLAPARPEDHAAGARVVRFSSPDERYAVARRMLERIASHRAVVLRIEDVQWGLDALGFVEHLLRAQEHTPSPVLVLLTARSDALEHYRLSKAQLERVMAMPHTRTLDITALPPQDHARLVRGLLWLAGDLAAQVETRTAGNPLFAVQLVGDWVQRGVLEVGDTGFRLRSGEKAAIPDNIHDLWNTRIARVVQGLSGDAGPALEMAAALGLEVQNDEWSRACEVAGIELADQLPHELFATGHALHVEAGWEFAHGMMRENLERTAREQGRWASHNLACAQMIETLYPPGQRGRAERIGRHLLDAGRDVQAVDPLLAGANERRETSDYSIALVLLQRREDAMRRARIGRRDARWAQGWIATAETYRCLGDLERAEARGARAAALAEQEGLTQLLADALVSRGAVAKERGDYSEARRFYREALALYEAQHNAREGLKAQWGLGVVSLVTGAFDAAAELLHACLRTAEAQAELLVAADAHHQLAGLARKLGRLEDAEQHIQSARDAYEAVGNRIGVANCINGLAEMQRFRGDLEAAEEGYRKALAIHSAISYSEGTIARANLALVLLQRGEFDEARRHLEEVHGAFAARHVRALQGLIAAALLPCLAHDQDWEPYEAYHAEATELVVATSIVDPDIAWPAQRAGAMALANGRPDLARRAWELALGQWWALGSEQRVREVATLLDGLRSVT